MAKLYFKYKGVSFIADAQIFNLNGKINCNISNIIDERNDQASNFVGFKGKVSLSADIALMNAINIGLKQYIDNYPIDHKETSLINTQYDQFASASPPSHTRPSIENTIRILGNYATSTHNRVIVEK